MINSIPTFHVKQTNVISYVKNRPSKRNSSNSKSKNYRHYTPREHTSPADIPQIKKILPLDWEAMHFTEDFVISFLDKGGKFYKKLFWKNAPNEVKEFIEETGATPNELYVWWKNNLTEMPICPACGNVIRLFGNYYELHTFCSSKCARRNKKQNKVNKVQAVSKKRGRKKGYKVKKNVKFEKHAISVLNSMVKLLEMEKLLKDLNNSFLELKKAIHE